MFFFQTDAICRLFALVFYYPICLNGLMKNLETTKDVDLISKTVLALTVVFAYCLNVC